MEQYLQFCQEERLQAIPGSSKTVSAFLVWFVERQSGATASVAGKLSQLRCGMRKYFKRELLSKYEEKEVADIIKALRFDDWRGTRRMDPVTVGILARLSAVRSDNTLLDLLIKLSRAVAHNGLLRSGELTSGRRGKHVRLLPGAKGGFGLRLGRTKTGRTGPGPEVAYLGRGANSTAALERKWRLNTGRGPDRPEEFWLPELIVRPSGEAVGIDWTRSLSRKTFVAVLRYDIARIGLESQRYCGHSFRAGGATDLFASGQMTHAEIMVMGRWKSLAAALVYFRADLEAARKSARVFERESAKYNVVREMWAEVNRGNEGWTTRKG